MNTKPRFPRFLYVICALIGGVMGILTNFLVLPQFLETNENTYLYIILLSFPAAGVGALFGILAGRIGYAIKPRKGVSIGGSVLGGADLPIPIGQASPSTQLVVQPQPDSALVNHLVYIIRFNPDPAVRRAALDELEQLGLVESL